MSIDIASLRAEYTLASLSEYDVNSDPISQFNHWFQESLNSKIEDPNAMTLCTVDASNKAHGRIVLLKGVEDNSFVFFTNYHSHKGQELAQNPHASLVFLWKELQRQVRIEGIVQKISDEASGVYFQSRPRESQIGAWASAQSEVLANRTDLEEKFKSLQESYQDKLIPKPPHWGGYALKPELIEFWQGRASRLHDRICYTLQENNAWKIERLSP